MLISAFSRRFRSLPINTQGWLICVAVLLLTVVRSSMTYSFGVFVVKLESQDNSTAVAVQNWIGTLPFSLSHLMSPVSVLLIRTLGQHGYQIVTVVAVVTLTCSCFLSSVVASINEMWMFLTHSVLYGVGLSLIYMSSSLVIGEYFDKEHKHHVLATAILLCGYPVGSLLFNPINGWLIESYGIAVTFRVCGCIILLVGLPCCLLLLSKLDTDTNDPVDYGDYKRRMNSCCNPKQCAVRPEIGLWLLGNMMTFIGYYMPFMNLAYYMKQENFDLNQSKWILTILSLVECIAYAIASVVGDYFKGKLILINLISAAGLSAIYFVWPFVDSSYGSILATSAILGAFLGLTIVYQYAASGEVTQLPIDVAWAATNLWSGLGSLVGPLLSGAIFDIRHSYDDVWFVCGALYFAQLLVFASILVIWRCRAGKFLPEDYKYIEIMGETKDNTDDAEEAEATDEGWVADNARAAASRSPARLSDSAVGELTSMEELALGTVGVSDIKR